MGITLKGRYSNHDEVWKVILIQLTGRERLHLCKSNKIELALEGQSKDFTARNNNKSLQRVHLLTYSNNI